MSAHTSSVAKLPTSGRVHEASLLCWLAFSATLILGPPTMPLNGQEKQTLASHKLSSTPTSSVTQSSVFKYNSRRNQNPGPGVFSRPQHTYPHTLNQRTNQPTSPPLTLPPPLVKFGTVCTVQCKLLNKPLLACYGEWQGSWPMILSVKSVWPQVFPRSKYITRVSFPIMGVEMGWWWCRNDFEMNNYWHPEVPNHSDRKG